MISDTRKDPTKYHLDSHDTFAGEDHPLARDIDDLATAELLRDTRMRELKESQPSSMSGGQSGIQNRVYIIRPESN